MRRRNYGQYCFLSAAFSPLDHRQWKQQADFFAAEAEVIAIRKRRAMTWHCAKATNVLCGFDSAYANVLQPRAWP